MKTFIVVFAMSVSVSCFSQISFIKAKPDTNSTEFKMKKVNELLVQMKLKKQKERSKKKPIKQYYSARKENNVSALEAIK